MASRLLSAEISEDAAYIYLTGNRDTRSRTTIALTSLEESSELGALDAIALDFDDDDRLIGVEVLSPERWLPKDLVAEGSAPRDR